MQTLPSSRNTNGMPQRTNYCLLHMCMTYIKVKVMMLHPNMLFDKCKDSHRREQRRKAGDKAKEEKKGGKYKAPWVLQHTEPSIYRGGTTAKE